MYLYYLYEKKLYLGLKMETIWSLPRGVVCDFIIFVDHHLGESPSPGCD